STGTDIENSDIDVDVDMGFEDIVESEDFGSDVNISENDTKEDVIVEDEKPNVNYDAIEGEIIEGETIEEEKKPKKRGRKKKTE
ncbi:MAG: hypothetical protein ACOC3V_03245, partial [bacterium]